MMSPATPYVKILYILANKLCTCEWQSCMDQLDSRISNYNVEMQKPQDFARNDILRPSQATGISRTGWCTVH